MVEDATDKELDALAQRVRAHRRKQWFAKGAGVALAFAGIVLGVISDFLISEHLDPELGARAFWVVGAIGALSGAMVYRKLDPPGSLHDVE